MPAGSRPFVWRALHSIPGRVARRHILKRVYRWLGVPLFTRVPQPPPYLPRAFPRVTANTIIVISIINLLIVGITLQPSTQGAVTSQTPSATLIFPTARVTSQKGTSNLAGTRAGTTRTPTLLKVKLPSAILILRHGASPRYSRHSNNLHGAGGRNL
jgi:hypothetical protein